MSLKIVKPTTPSKRNLVLLNKNRLKKKPILKKNIYGTKNNSGRNNSGRITVYHKGGGVKQSYRKINFFREENSVGIICSIEYDPNRSSFIASVFDSLKNDFYYILSPQNLKVGDIIKSGFEIEPSLGSSLPLSEIPVGTFIHNISTKISKKAQISRAAGTYSVIREKNDKYSTISLKSGKQKVVSNKCFATIGLVSNEFHFLTQAGKAGNSRWLNKRPTVRGVAMNPIDHPHGGGEGKKSGRSLSPWGKPNTKKVKSKTSKKTN